MRAPVAVLAALLSAAWVRGASAFGGPATDELYATCGDKVFRRKMRARGVLSWREPVKPAAPRL